LTLVVTLIAPGTFRISCEFLHFAYDDPLVYPNKPGAAHLHMYWGNTDVNAFSTFDTLFNSGSSTCNGMELNRTGYWAPAMFDAQGNVRIPDRIIAYHKGYGLANGASQVFPPKAAMVINDRVQRAEMGGVAEPNFLCSDQFRAVRQKGSSTIPNCNEGPYRRTLEMRVKFGNCWNRNDPSNPTGNSPSREIGSTVTASPASPRPTFATSLLTHLRKVSPLRAGICRPT
jgi:hypothetical protein